MTNIIYPAIISLIIVTKNLRVMNYEKNVSTKQDKKKKIPWVSCTYGNSRWAQGLKQKKTTGSLAADSLTYSFTRKMHVRKKWEFGKIRALGVKHYGKYICFQYLIDPKEQQKLGLTVSKKFGDAVSRNLFKRRMKEIYRHLVPYFPQSLHINILPLQGGKSASFEELFSDWSHFITTITKGSSDATQT